MRERKTYGNKIKITLRLNGLKSVMKRNNNGINILIYTHTNLNSW